MTEIAATNPLFQSTFARLGLSPSVPKGLFEVVSPCVDARGCEIVAIEFRREPAGWVLRIFIERPGGNVLLDDCVHISRDVSTVLDTCTLIDHAFHLEISSPGLERPLSREEHFVRFAGEKVKIHLVESMFQPPRKVIRGQLIRLENGQLHVADDHIGEVAIDLQHVAKAHLRYESAASTPAKSPKKKAKNNTSKS
jgi:ribosome maturation factor RimP